MDSFQERCEHRLSAKVRFQIRKHQFTHCFSCFIRSARDVRHHDFIIQLSQLRRDIGFALEHVESGAGDAA